jgi:hypothetical protein
MIDAALMIVVVGAIVLALAVDIGVVVRWITRVEALQFHAIDRHRAFYHLHDRIGAGFVFAGVDAE